MDEMIWTNDLLKTSIRGGWKPLPTETTGGLLGSLCQTMVILGLMSGPLKYAWTLFKDLCETMTESNIYRYYFNLKYAVSMTINVAASAQSNEIELVPCESNNGILCNR